MRAMVLTQQKPVEESPLALGDIAEPRPAADEVRVKVSVCAVCRTDIHIVEGSNGMLIEVDGQILPNYDATIVPFEEGDVVTGKVVRIDKDEVLVDIGYSSFEGITPSDL